MVLYMRLPTLTRHNVLTNPKGNKTHDFSRTSIYLVYLIMAGLKRIFPNNIKVKSTFLAHKDFK